MKTQNKEKCIHSTLAKVTENTIGLVAFIHSFIQILGFPDSFPDSFPESACNAGDHDSWVGKIPWRRGRLPTPVFLGFPCGLAGKESAYNEGNLGSVPGLGRSPGEWKGYPLQYSGLENSMDYTVHRITKSGTQLSDFHFHTC